MLLQRWVLDVKSDKSGDQSLPGENKSETQRVIKSEFSRSVWWTFYLLP